MSVVDIPMNDWSVGRLEAGSKTATARTKQYGEPGDTFEVAGQLYEFTHVVKVPLAVVAQHFYEEEGAASPDEFAEVWEDIHYLRGFEPDWDVWLHLFTPAKPHRSVSA